MQTSTQPTTSIRAFTIATFDSLLPKRIEMGDTAFRKAVTGTVENEFGIKHSAATSHYNFAKNLAEETGKVEPFGRSKRLKNKPQAPVRLATDNWAILCKNTRQIQGYAKTRRLAYSAKTATQTIAKL